jgi:hypothetical protein
MFGILMGFAFTGFVVGIILLILGFGRKQPRLKVSGALLSLLCFFLVTWPAFLFLGGQRLASSANKREHVFLCKAGQPIEQCQYVKATLSYDGMDGIYVVHSVTQADGTVLKLDSKCWFATYAAPAVTKQCTDDKGGSWILAIAGY